jgi:hypothetical protein
MHGTLTQAWPTALARSVRPARPPPAPSGRRPAPATPRSHGPATRTQTPAARAGAAPHPIVVVPDATIVAAATGAGQQRRVGSPSLEGPMVTKVGGGAAVGELHPQAQVVVGELPRGINLVAEHAKAGLLPGDDLAQPHPRVKANPLG